MVDVVELVNTGDCESPAERLAGSSPVVHPNMITVKIELDTGDDDEDMDFDELADLVQEVFDSFNWSAKLIALARDE